MSTSTFKQERSYNRIFTGSNQTDGYENVYLGYNSNVTSISFDKDSVTSFHIPYFTAVTDLSASTLVAEGAIGGALPAASDRIYKVRSEYGENTPLGTSVGIQNGTWLCSWLYSVPGAPAIWLDRYYNPHALTYSDAFRGIYSPYINDSSLFVDIPSKMTLDPGVYYEYFHVGENTAQKMVDSFSGKNNDKLVLQYTNYDSSIKDNSIYHNDGRILNYSSNWSKYNTNTEFISCNYLNFNNNDLIIAEASYNSSYSLKNEFTFNVYVKHTNWDNAQSTQLAGNYNDGGFGLFYNNLKYYPYFVIPETTYGHLLFFNQEFNAFLDQSSSIQNTTITKSNPIQVSLNGEREIFVINNLIYSTDQSLAGSGIFKYNHLGDILAYYYFDTGVIAEQFIIDKFNNLLVVTNGDSFVLDRNLNFIQKVSNPYSEKNFKLVYNLNGELQYVRRCLDAIVDNNNVLWSINLNGQVIYNNNIFDNSPTQATNLAVDPNNNIWILYGNNQVAVYDAKTQTLINNFYVGSFVCSPVSKNISFIHQYNRKTNTHEWFALIYTDNVLYTLTLDGTIDNTIYLSTLVNTYQSIKQDLSKTTFAAIGDFTGYEWSRINNVALYKNIPQLQFKLSTNTVNTKTKSNLQMLSVPADYLNNNAWYVITVVYENYNFYLYVNERLVGQATIPYDEEIVNVRENTFYVGTPNGKIDNLNTEVKTDSLIFNGQISNINIYNYAINPNFIQYFIHSLTVGSNLIWCLPTSVLQYIETVDRFFKNKIPGSKSQFFKLKISGAQITNTETRTLVETYIKNIIQQTKPAYTELVSIEWI
jgi:hypothetical protein